MLLKMKNPTETAEFFIYLNEFDKAKIVLNLLKPYAKSIEQINQLGTLYAEIREFNDTLELSELLYDIVDDTIKFDVRTNMIRAYLNLNKPKAALKYILLNEQERPNDQPTQMDRALAHFLLNEKDKGEIILRKILESPHNNDILNRVKFNLGSYDLRNGNFKEGLNQVLLGGRKLNIWKDFKFSKEQLWTGSTNLSGRNIIVCAEGGIGDEIISIRFMKHLKELGANPIWYTDRMDLSTIFTRCGFSTINSLSNIPNGWLWTYSMPVPCYLNLDEDNLWHGPYLNSLNKCPLLPGNKKIGIKTMGNPKYDQDLHRTIPFNELIDAIPEDYTIYSFHIDEDFNHPRVISLKNKINSWNDTLDYINQMDLIISSCTSLIHAAGALGKESIVIVPILTYYTWAKLGDHTKWYGDNLRILRQTEYNNWNSPLVELKQLLEIRRHEPTI